MLAVVHLHGDRAGAHHPIGGSRPDRRNPRV